MAPDYYVMVQIGDVEEWYTWADYQLLPHPYRLYGKDGNEVGWLTVPPGNPSVQILIKHFYHFMTDWLDYSALAPIPAFWNFAVFEDNTYNNILDRYPDVLTPIVDGSVYHYS